MHSEINDYEIYDPANDEGYDDYDLQDYEAYSESYEDEAEENFVTAPSGGHRVLRLSMILLVLILITALILFGVIPYVEAMTSNVPPLPPPVQA
jgi:hypothetical protein